MRILLAGHPTIGHTNALTTVGGHLLARGFDIRFALPAMPRPPFPVPEIIGTAASLPNTIAAAGLRVVRLRPAYRSLVYDAVLPISSAYANPLASIGLLQLNSSCLWKVIGKTFRSNH